MRVLVRHGHFAFYPRERDEVQKFRRIFGIQLHAERDYFTFQGLVGLPRWSQVGRVFGNLPAVATYEGQTPWDVMRANNFVYSLATGFLIPISAVTATTSLPQSLDYAIASRPLVQPGSVIVTSAKVLTGYEGELDIRGQQLSIYSIETLI